MKKSATPCRRYVLDTNIFIEAHRRYYAFDLCPGFWDAVTRQHAEMRLISIDRVKKEICNGDELESWVKKTAPHGFFASTQQTDVVQCFQGMMAWVQNNPQFLPMAKAEFAREADGWLAAYAKTNHWTLVTHEEYSRDAKKRVLLPNLCREFDIDYVDTFIMLRDLEVKFHLLINQ